MTLETLTFIRNILCQLSLKVGEQDFTTTATLMITALEELDKEIANASDPIGRDIPGAVISGRTGVSITPRLHPQPPN